ncbi:MAG: DNA mismatch repair endonuclease MutL [Eubacteriales bacterium]|nr:DNA mismatch repair endonuclease MutL [Eubacteriales bacterium]
MGVIRLLPKETIDKIAAGEVVVNAASVIKELAENSIDAGAKHIYILTKAGGKKLIRVIDDGCGMLREDLPLAFTRNATSKIYDDISAISSLGFRGEALSSISYVSNVTVVTRSEKEELGTRAEVVSNEIVSTEDIACTVGTTIEVTDLFYNFPARLKHLGTDQSENRAIVDITSRIALSHPEISFTLACDDRNIFSTSGNSNMLSAINSIFGRRFSEGLIPVEFENKPLKVKGFISSPNFIDPKSAERILILNGRYIRSDVITKAVDSVYMDYYSKTGAGYVLFVELPYQMVDINIHPAKTTARFLNESLVIMLIRQGIRDRLKDAFALKERVPSVKDEEEEDPFEKLEEAYVAPAEQTSERPAEQPSGDRPLPQSAPRPAAAERAVPRVVSAPSMLDPGSLSSREGASAQQDAPLRAPKPETLTKEIFLKLKNMRHIGNAFGLYALIEDADTLYIIDTHAAHERVLFERYRDSFLSGDVGVQELLVPVTCELSRKQFAAAMDNVSLFESLGFTIEEFSDSGIIIRSVPVFLSGTDCAERVRGIIDELLEYPVSATDIARRNDVIIRRACHSAVRGAQNISSGEVAELLEQLYECEMPFTCPHGRPVIGKISEKYFMKVFERIQ